MDTDAHRYKPLTERIIGCLYAVSNGLGCGFLEKVYENAVLHALHKAGLGAQAQVRFPVYFDGVEVGEYIADIVVEGTVLLELKAVKSLDDVHVAQCINLLKATKLPVCLLANFARPKIELRRFVGEQPM